MPGTSCDLPGSSNGPLSIAPLFGLSPGGGYKASPVARRTGALLPHLFTLTPPEGGAVYFLLHFPSRFRDSTLWSTLPCGVRTFLRIVDGIQRSSGLLEPHHSFKYIIRWQLGQNLRLSYRYNSLYSWGGRLTLHPWHTASFTGTTARPP